VCCVYFLKFCDFSRASVPTHYEKSKSSCSDEFLKMLKESQDFQKETASEILEKS